MPMISTALSHFSPPAFTAPYAANPPGVITQNLRIQNSDTHEASLHHQMDENGKDLFSG
jgi:hypothetical protein